MTVANGEGANGDAARLQLFERLHPLAARQLVSASDLGADVTRQLQGIKRSDGAHSSLPRSVRRRSNGGLHLGRPRISVALGEDAASVESVQVLDKTPYDQLRRRRGIAWGVSPGQKNLLVRVVLRDLERTLTDADANILRDRIYAAIHKGSVWARASEVYECHGLGARGESPPESFEQHCCAGQ
jgi:hypothetical protein